MNKTKRMKVVQNYTKDCSCKAAKVVANSRKALDIQQERLEQLANYREEYWRNLAAGGSATMNAARLQDFRLFLSRLDKAIEQQRNMVDDANQCYCRDNAEWNRAMVRERSIDCVVEKMELRDRKHQDKQEQKSMDEMGQKIRIRIFEQ
ncbi:MAG: flagellar export protein FliJ [Gammaproteobacteria bacterium]|nr:MAG: flagellar export protein FliJ [Gammaproteobacteria bacterium]